jgi:hypothetical protein
MVQVKILQVKILTIYNMLILGWDLDTIGWLSDDKSINVNEWLKHHHLMYSN